MKDLTSSHLKICRHRLSNFINQYGNGKGSKYRSSFWNETSRKNKGCLLSTAMESHEITHALHRLSVIELFYLRQRNKEIWLKMAVRKCSGWWRDNLVRSMICSDNIELQIRREVRMSAEWNVTNIMTFFKDLKWTEWSSSWIDWFVVKRRSWSDKIQSFMTTEMFLIP